MMLGLDKQAFFATVLVFFLFSKTLMAASCKNLDDWSRAEVEEESLLISLLRVNSRPVSPAFEVYPYKNTYLLSVTGLNQLLQLGWKIDREIPSVVSTGNEEVIDLCSFSIVLPKSQNQSELFWAQDEFDTYIDIAALPHMLGGSAQYKFNLLQLDILSELDFPGLSGVSGIPNLQARHTLVPDREVDDGYRRLTPAIINYRLTGNYDSAQSDGRLVASSNVFFDVANHALEFRVNSTESNTQQFLRLSKNLNISGDEAAKNMLRYEVGDIQLQSDELIHRSTQALGVAIFNFDPSYSRSFSQITIEETILPGWRAQLFRNGQFLQESFSNEQNRVVFEQVDTFHGTNLFEIKLYGPEGQKEERYQTINVGTQQLTPGRFNYSFNVSDAGKRFIDSDNPEARYDQNLSALVSYGLSHKATVEASVHSVRGLDQQQDFASSALYMNFANTAFKTQWVKDLDAGDAIFIGLNANIAKALRANFSARYFNDFESAAYPQSRDIKAEAQLRLNGRVGWWEGVSWSSSLQHRAYNKRDDSNEVSLSLSRNLLGGTLSSSLTYNDALIEERLRHRVFWSKNIAGWQISNSIEWLPSDDQEILSYYSVIRWPQQYDTYNQSRIEYRADREDNMLFTHLFNWRQESFNLQFGASVTDGGEWTVNLGISGDIEYDMFDQQFKYFRPRGSVANLHALAYLDNNRNSIFDVGDDTLSDVGMSGHGKWRERRTDAQGLMQLPTSSQIQSIHIDDTTLSDPYMYSVDSLVHVNTHRGGISWVQLPVVTFNDVEGAVYRSNNKFSRGVSGLAVELVDPEGKVVAETQTELDGYFFFTQVPPGQFTLQLDAEYLESNDLTIANLPKLIEATEEGDSLRVNDVLLVDRSPMSELAVESDEEAPVAVELDEKPQMLAEPDETAELDENIPQYVELDEKPLIAAEPDKQVPLTAELDEKPQVEPKWGDKPDLVEIDKFYVQLGAFKSPGSVINMLKHLPTEEYDLKVFRNHLTGLSYVVMGGYVSEQDAELAADMFKTETQFTGSYVKNGSKYFSKGWSLEYQALGIPEHLLLSHQAIKDAPVNSYFCQLESFSTLKAISAEMLNDIQVVHLAHRQVNNKYFYTLYTGPVTNPLECQKPSVRQLSENVPFALSTATLRTQIVESP